MPQLQALCCLFSALHLVVKACCQTYYDDCTVTQNSMTYSPWTYSEQCLLRFHLFIQSRVYIPCQIKPHISFHLTSIATPQHDVEIFLFSADFAFFLFPWWFSLVCWLWFLVPSCCSLWVQIDTLGYLPYSMLLFILTYLFHYFHRAREEDI